MLLRLPDVITRTALSRSIIYELLARNAFPAPVKLYPGSRLNGWPAEEIDAFVAARIAEREAA